MRNSRWYITFLLSLIFFTVTLDLIVGKLYKSLYFSERSSKNDRLIHSVKHACEDILIFGSSRAEHHYNPELISKATGMTVYNMGSGGQNIYYHLALLQSVLEKHKPKLVILELLSIDFLKTPLQWNTEKLGVLLPFADNSNACFMAVLRRGYLEHLKMLSKIYPFNSLQCIIFRNLFYPINNSINGFVPIKVSKKITTAKNKDSKEIVYDSLKMEALFAFIDLCQRNNVDLQLFISPRITHFSDDSPYDSISELILKRYGIAVIDFSNDSLFINHFELFTDKIHLNEKGAEIYSKIVSEIINENGKRRD